MILKKLERRNNETQYFSLFSSQQSHVITPLVSPRGVSGAADKTCKERQRRNNETIKKISLPLHRMVLWEKGEMRHVHIKKILDLLNVIFVVFRRVSHYFGWSCLPTK